MIYVQLTTQAKIAMGRLLEFSFQLVHLKDNLVKMYRIYSSFAGLQKIPKSQPYL